MSDTFTHDVLMSVRRSMFRKLRGLGLSQDVVTQTVARASSAAVRNANVADLAAIASAAAPLRAALAAANPTDPALAAFDGVKESVGTPVRDLLEPEG